MSNYPLDHNPRTNDKPQEARYKCNSCGEESSEIELPAIRRCSYVDANKRECWGTLSEIEEYNKEPDMFTMGEHKDRAGAHEHALARTAELAAIYASFIPADHIKNLSDLFAFAYRLGYNDGH